MSVSCGGARGELELEWRYMGKGGRTDLCAQSFVIRFEACVMSFVVLYDM